MATQGHSSEGKLYWIRDNLFSDHFPEVSAALREPNGLLAVGGDLSTTRLIEAYQSGIFPWFSADQPILWWSPEPRCVLEPDDLKVSRSLRKILRQRKMWVSFNLAFDDVLRACAAPRKQNHDTWLTKEMRSAYRALHAIGIAHSVECWSDGRLIGGCYGVCLGRVFFGESMFSIENNASKVALTHLVIEAKKRQFRLIDCQVYSAHLLRLGAKLISRKQFIAILKEHCSLKKTYDWPGQADYEW